MRVSTTFVRKQTTRHRKTDKTPGKSVINAWSIISGKPKVLPFTQGQANKVVLASPLSFSEDLNLMKQCSAASATSK
jgi:hypothetical protein